MDENEPQTHRSHGTDDPSAGDGRPDGQPTAAVGGPVPGPDFPMPGGPDGSSAHGGQPEPASAAFWTGAEGLLPSTWCRSCKEKIQPEGKGTCPKCGQFLRRNFVARQHPQNRLRVDQLRDQLTAEYSPTSMQIRSAVDALAVVLERLESVKAGTPEHQRLVDVQARLFATLNDSLSAGKESGTFSALSDDELIERTAALLEMLIAKRDGTTTNYEPTEIDTGDAGHSARLAPAEAGAKSACVLAPEPEQCSYCRKSIADCASLKEKRLDIWQINHFGDPPEIERRRLAYQQRETNTRKAFRALGITPPEY